MDKSRLLAIIATLAALLAVCATFPRWLSRNPDLMVRDLTGPHPYGATELRRMTERGQALELTAPAVFWSETCKLRWGLPGPLRPHRSHKSGEYTEPPDDCDKELAKGEPTPVLNGCDGCYYFLEVLGRGEPISLNVRISPAPPARPKHR